MNKIKVLIEKISNDKKSFLILFTKITIFTLCVVAGLIFIITSKIQELKWYDWTFFVDIFIGVLAAFLLAQNYKYSYILLMVDSILYGISLIGQQNFASGAVNILVIPLILLIPIFTYKNQDLKIETRSLSKNKNLIATFVILVSSLIVFGITIGIMEAFKVDSERSKWFLLIDSIVSILTIFGFTYSGFRYREAWICFLVMNFIRIVMYIVLLSLKDENFSILSLFISITYFINHILGFFNWKPSKEKI